MTLFQLTLLLGIVLLLGGAVWTSCTRRVQDALLDFPRSRWIPRIMLLGELPWAAWLLIQEPPVAGNAQLARLVLIAVPIAYILLVLYMDELLAPRCLGGLLLLLAAPFLDAARWHDSAWRYVVIVSAYVAVVVGIILVMNPYKFRRSVSGMAMDAVKCRRGGMIVTAMGLVFVALALLAFRSGG